jgi:hypothetical protein
MALHPDDLLRPGLRESALQGIDAALEGGAVALTYDRVLEAGPPLVAPVRLHPAEGLSRRASAQ